MEKKRNHLARNGQGNSDYKTKSQDVSSKQFPRQQRRRESFQSESVNNTKQQQQQSKNRSNNFYYDKRPQARKGNGVGVDQQGGASGEATGLNDADELNSVFNYGSKKQNLNHLLNFHYYSAKETEVPRAGTFSKHGYHNQHRANNSKKYNFNKEQYLQANCQFVVKSDLSYDYRPFSVTPDSLVEWSQIVKILVSSSEESQCPICLYPPKAAKMTRCGHIFCFACMLHYLSLSDKTWRKCPICYESVHLQDLKSTSSKHCHRSYKIGDVISMELMSREKGSLHVSKADEIRNTKNGEFPNFSDGDDHFTYSKLIMADSKEVLQILEQEKNELEFQLIEDGDNCPESIFVQQAMDLLKIKNDLLETAIQAQLSAEKSNSLLNPSVAAFVPSQKHEIVEDSAESHEARNELIDDECNLTVNDIDIVPAATCQSKHFYYYQAPNAQNVFLHSINSRMLQQTYDSLDKSPQTIRGRIVQIECCTMNEDLRKRLKYLQHLPVSSVFEVVEIEFDPGFVSHDVVDMFKDELFHRRKIRQRRDRDEKKREKVINEINDRQMGKMMKAASANINIDSTSQFPECGSFTELPTLASNFSDRSASPTLSSSPAGPSFATMLTTSKARKAEKLWPSLSTDVASTSSTSSFFGDKKLVHVTGNKSMMATPQLKVPEEDEDSIDEDVTEMSKAPAYKNQLGDCLANALAKSVSLKDTPKSNGKKKKAKKTLLFASGMNFN